MSVDALLETSLESPSSSPTPEDNLNCPSCSEKMVEPIVLACLHVYCRACLQKQVDEKSQNGSECDFIECEKCKHETPVPYKGLANLTPEYVLIDIMEKTDIEKMLCTSCKAKEKATARCEDCANFICANCVVAHQFMRCFESHKVVSLEDLGKDSSKIHKPIYCPVHVHESLKLYCNTCRVSICDECITEDHKPPDHESQRVQDLETTERNNFQSLVTESKSKITKCEEVSSTLMASLGDLQTQRDNAKDLINETFQSYKAMLEKAKDDMLAELEDLQSSKELTIMDLCHNVEKAVEKLEDGVTLTEHILNNGSTLHLLLMKKVISAQLLSLINNVPTVEVDDDIEFITDSQVFEEAVKKSFGSFKKEIKALERPPSSLHSSFENEGFNLRGGNMINGPDVTQQPNFMGMPPVTPVSGSSVDFNFPQLHYAPHEQMLLSRSRSTIETRSLSRSSHSPAMSDSGISVDAGSTNSNSSASLVNIAALAKLGTVGYSQQGNITFNGQVVPGLNVSNITGMPPVGGGMAPIGSSRGSTPITEYGLPSANARPSSPDLETLTRLLNTQQSGFGSQFQQKATQGGLADQFQHLGAFPKSGNPFPGNRTPTFQTGGSLSDSTSSMNTVGSNQGSKDQTLGSGLPPQRRSNKMSAMQIRCKFGQLGPGKGQFNSPHGFCLGTDEDIVIADTNNHRIQVFEKTGELRTQFGIPGREEGQLWYPRKVNVLRTSGKYIVCDRGNERSRMQIFSKMGHFLRKIAIRYIDIVAGLAITAKGEIVAVDSVSPTVFVISENGELLKWFDCSDYMREPSDIAIAGKEYFVCDFKGHCVVVFNDEGAFQRRIGCENITNYPNGIDISDAGDVLIGDSHGNRFHVAVFQRDGSLIGEFECPYVKVSRCCGLRITAEGYVVTLAKNNHHVLVLNTLYIA